MNISLRLLATFVVAAAVIWLVGCKSDSVHMDASSNDAVERDIRAHLKIGSSAESVLAYLEQRKIQHYWRNPGVRLSGYSEVVDPDTGLPAPDAPTVEALIPRAQTDRLLGEVQVMIDFEFDAEKSKLANFTVHNRFTYK